MFIYGKLSKARKEIVSGKTDIKVSVATANLNVKGMINYGTDKATRFAENGVSEIVPQMTCILCPLVTIEHLSIVSVISGKSDTFDFWTTILSMLEVQSHISLI